MTALSDLLASAAQNAAAGRVDDALAKYRGALKRSPALAEVHYNVGVLLARKGDLDGAEKSLDQALRLKPSWAQAYLALGHLYFRQARYADAERSFGRAATLAPDSVEALFNLAASRDRQRRWGDALPPLESARRLAPDNEDIWFALRGHLLLFQREEEAFDDFRRFEPNAALSARVVAAGLLSARIAPGTDYEDKYLPLALDWPYQPGESAYAAVAVAQAQYFDLTREQLLRVYQAHDRVRQAERGSIADFAAPLLAADGERQIRVGYLSADFRSHVMGRLMFEVVRRHDAARFSVHAYSLAVREIEDEVTAQFRAACAGFRRLDDVDDASAAKLIADDGIDILVDLMGHSGSSRPAILLYKPAPVIITHLGNHGALGMRQVDFKLTDAHADLPDAQRYQIEAPLALDCCVLPFRRVAAAAEAPVTRADLGLSGETTVFGVFVSLLKLSPRCLGLWKRILDAVPDSVLAFSPTRPAQEGLYRRRLESFGIAPGRIVFVPWALDDAIDRARYRLIDVVLDTLPYTGGDTTAAAIDMGVPVVTRVGERQAERMTYSLLAHLGVTTTVAQNDDDYVSIAVRLARDRTWRDAVAADIVAALPGSGLADAGRYTRCLESAFERALALKPRHPG
ncbi:MAG TPA: tetratricopeptide repeat protein [Casimicrobiaceae bacterium]|nr:tetratricopeptide repeat protein [Casimicrobiaceae bacterium]